MKKCPTCGSTSFDDMDICYACMYHFDLEQCRLAQEQDLLDLPYEKKDSPQLAPKNAPAAPNEAPQHLSNNAHNEAPQHLSNVDLLDKDFQAKDKNSSIQRECPQLLIQIKLSLDESGLKVVSGQATSVPANSSKEKSRINFGAIS